MEQKPIELRKVVLKNVLTPEGEKDITVEVVPFNRRKDEHVDFAYAYVDMMGRMPSIYRNMSDAAVGYVCTFMVHKAEDEKNEASDFACVRDDKRASRILFNQAETIVELNDFFENA